MSPSVLVVDDEESARTGLIALLSQWGYAADGAADGEEALDKACATLPAVVLADLVMPRLDGLGLLRALQENLPFTTVILLSGQATIETAVAAMKEGAYDFLTKPVDVPRLKVLVARAAERADALREVAVLRRRVKQVGGLSTLVGNSPAMQQVYRLIEVTAPTPAPVLITGESGTGKELVARTLHELSPRGRGPFVAVNCAAIPETLLESEIFGHEKGAFTGAIERRPGCFEVAHGGTIFLDEIAEMAAATQAKFLRILEDGVVRRVGGKTEIRVDVRVLAATNKDPVQRMVEGTFREDLYYRLNVMTLPIPPLRERREDIPLLVEAFIAEFNAKYGKTIKGLTDPALQTLQARPWPGNVRELRNAIERAVIVCDADVIAAGHLAPGPEAPPAATRPDGAPGIVIPPGTTVDEAEKILILRTLESTANNKTQAAKALGISLKTLHNKLRRYGG